MRIAAPALLAVVTIGCRGILGIEEAAYIEADAAAQPACAEWQPRGIDPCELPAPAPALVIAQGDSPYTLDTTTRTLRSARGAVEMSWREVAQADQSKVFVIAVERLTIEAAARLEVIGRLPLVIASWTAIEVAGTIDAGSHLGRQVGPGANMSCGAMAGAPGAAAPPSGGSGGGGGGAFRGRGGSGGDGGNAPNPGGGGGLAVPVPGVLRGGCGGGDSGAAGGSAVPPSAPATVSLGGPGGGAIYLAARESIQIAPAAAVLAGGAGGAGAKLGSSCGGGGGGSGGYLGLSAGVIDLRGTLAANGGGGGGGSGFVMVWTASYQKDGGAVVSPTELLNMP
jgi:hypothetical protein